MPIPLLPSLLDVMNHLQEHPDTETVWEVLDEIILMDAFKDNPCLKGVYDQLGGSETFNGYLQPFEGDGTVANLRLGVGNPTNDAYLASKPLVNAYTNLPNNDNWIEIVVNTDNLNRPALDIARTMIHEMIHASIYRWMLQVAAEIGQGNISFEDWTEETLIAYANQIRNDFPGIYDFYARYEWGVSPEQASVAQHEQMAAFFVDIIAQALMQYDPNLSLETAKAIAWKGLKDTSSWARKTEAEKNAINALANDYLSNLPPNC